MLLSRIPRWLKYTYQILGILQCSVNRSTAVRSSPALIYILYVGLLLYVFPVYLRILDGLKIDKVYKYIDIDVTMAFASSVTINTYAFYRRRLKMRLVLEEIEELMLLEHHRRRPRKYIGVYTSMAAALLQCGLNFCYFPSVVFAIQMFHLFPVVVNVFDFIFARELLDFLKHEFRAINSYMDRQISKKSLNVLFPFTEDQKLEGLRRQDTAWTMRSVWEYSHRHYRLVGVAKVLNQLFGVTILTTLVEWFVLYTTTLYFMVYVALNFSLLRVFRILVNNSTWVFGYLWYILVQIYVWNTVQLEANRTSEHIHAFWNKHASNKCTPKADLHCMSLVSLRLLNTKLQFTAKGLLAFDWTLMHTVTASIVTYVVLLLQFRI